MRKAVLSVLVVISLVTVAVVSVRWLDNSGRYSAGQAPTNMHELVECSNDFSFGMYRELAAGSDENIFFSPYSITTALGMAYEGARGDTAAEMSTVLNLPTDNQIRWDMVRDYQTALNAESEDYELATANAYWLRQGENLNSEYRDAIENYYLAHGDELDFAGDPAGSADTINTWVEDQTHDRIQDLISPLDITPYTYLVLTNAIYFLADWQYQFDANATENRTFHTTSQGDIIAETMHMNDDTIGLNYSENNDVQMLQLPYKNNELSMYILLPKGDDISGLEENLDYDYFNNLKEHMKPEWVDLYLPKFELEQKYKLNDALADMGMPTAFTPAADFSGISADSRNLWIEKVIHQSFVKVDEEGTEAAAATAVILVCCATPSPTPEPILFEADHPFIFLIQHEITGQLLFMGRVGNPAG